MFCSLKSGIESITKKNRLKKYFVFDKVVKIWQKEIDSQIQENTKIINFYNGVITIETVTPTWKTELAFQKTKILNKKTASRKISRTSKKIK